MDYILIALTSFFASGVTLFSGFGLGTILTPVFALFFPLPVAIAATAVVHLANNLFKGIWLARLANKEIVIRFGLSAIVASFCGAGVLKLVSNLPVILTYTINGHPYSITAVKLLIGLAIIIFSLLELIPAFSRMTFQKEHLGVGGLLSGFFGGLSGHQGALRAMFLKKTNLNQEEFLATNVVLGIMVDLTRLVVYGALIFVPYIDVLRMNLNFLLTAILAAFFGAFLGIKLIKKITLQALHLCIGVMLIAFGLALSLGLI